MPVRYSLSFGVLLAVLLFASRASAQTPVGSGAAEVEAIYPEIEKLYMELHRNPELPFQEHRTAGEPIRGQAADVDAGSGNDVR